MGKNIKFFLIIDILWKGKLLLTLELPEVINV